MTDPNPNTPATPPQQPPQQPQQPDPPATPPPAQGDPPASPGQQDPPGPVPYDRFKQVNDELKQIKDQLAKQQEEQKKQKDKELAEQEKWKELADQREAELKAEKLARTRLEIASKKGIPPDLAGRLQGETAEDMEKDADALLQHLRPATGPGVPPGSPGSQPAKIDLSKMTPEEIRKLDPDKKRAAMTGQ